MVLTDVDYFEFLVAKTEDPRRCSNNRRIFTLEKFFWVKLGVEYGGSSSSIVVGSAFTSVALKRNGHNVGDIQV
jgi:hypothetical protein